MSLVFQFGDANMFGIFVSITDFFFFAARAGELFHFSSTSLVLFIHNCHVVVLKESSSRVVHIKVPHGGRPRLLARVGVL